MKRWKDKLSSVLSSHSSPRQSTLWTSWALQALLGAALNRKHCTGTRRARTGTWPLQKGCAGWAVHWWQLHTEVIFYRLVQLRKLQALFLTLRFKYLQFFFQPVLCWSLPSPTDTWKIQQVKGKEFFFSSFSKTVNTSTTLFAQKTLNTKILLSFPSQLLEHLISLVKWMLQRK